MKASRPLHVERWGSGPDVTFLHGLGASSRYWHAVGRELPDVSGLAPDLLSFGRSPAPSDSSYDVDAHLDALVSVLPGPSLVVAHSTGCLLAAALGARRPDLGLGLVLVGAPAFPDDATAVEEIGRLGLLARLTVDESRWSRWLWAAMCHLRPVAIAAAPLLSRDLPRAIAGDGARHTWQSYSRTLREVVVEHRALPDLLAYDGPVVALHGRDDRTAPVGYVQGLASMLAAAGRSIDVRVVEGDHHLAIRRPDVVAETVAECAGR